MIESIDSNGYLVTDVDQIAEDLKVDGIGLKKVLRIIQTFEPAGCRS